MDNSYLAIQIALIVGVTEAVKQAFLLDRHYKYIPLLAVGLGLFSSVLLFPGATWQGSLVDGIIAGLSSVGLFSTVRNTLTKTASAE